MVSVGECAQKAAGLCLEAGAGRDGRFCLHKKEQGFKKSERIKQEVLFKRLFREGRYFKSANFSLRLSENNINISRLGISVQARIFPNATQRNRVKRLVREVFRKNKQALAKGCDIIVRPKNQVLFSASYQEIEKELLGLFKQADILKGQ